MMRVALIKTGALGDVVRTTALLPGLRRLAPDLELTWVTAPGAVDLVRGHPDVARTALIDAPDDASWRHEHYDWVISLDDEPEMCCLASRLSASRRSGAYETELGERSYTADVEAWFGMGILRPVSQGGLDRANALKRLNDRTVADLLYETLGLPLPIGKTFIDVPDHLDDQARHWLSDAGLGDASPVIGMNTGAGGRWRFKSWGEDQTATLAQSLHDEHSAGVVILGGPAEERRNGNIVRAADRPGVIAGETDLGLLEFTALIGRCDLLITSDTLALHLAVARGVPVVSFFGPTSMAEIELYGRGEKVVTPLDCRCCYLRDCDAKPNCMQAIRVEDLRRAANRCLIAGRVNDTSPPNLPRPGPRALWSSEHQSVEPRLVAPTFAHG
jgi:heptosyltransferase-2